VLFIDARKLGAMVDRTHRELTDEDMARVAETYHAWRGDKGAGPYADVAGFCMAAKVAEIENHGFVLTPGRYVGVAGVVEDEDFDFAETMADIHAELAELNLTAQRLSIRIQAAAAELVA
jgi:type I restriction enzyme M protein